MVLLTEFQNASIESKGRKTIITGKFLAGGVKNKNGRIYPVHVLHEAVEARRSDMLNGGLFGNLGHPADGVADESKISHVVTALDRKGNDWFGKARLVNEGYGKIARSIIECGGRMGVSSRGMGDLRKKDGANIVESYVLHGIDLVTSPSGPGCNVKALTESVKKWPVYEQHIANEVLRKLYEDSDAAATLKPGEAFPAVGRTQYDEDPISKSLFAGHAAFPSIPDDRTYLERLRAANEELIEKLAKLHDKVEMDQPGFTLPRLRKYVDALRKGHTVSAQQTLRREMQTEAESLMLRYQAMKLLGKIAKANGGIDPALNEEMQKWKRFGRKFENE